MLTPATPRGILAREQDGYTDLIAFLPRILREAVRRYLHHSIFLLSSGVKSRVAAQGERDDEEGGGSNAALYDRFVIDEAYILRAGASLYPAADSSRL